MGENQIALGSWRQPGRINAPGDVSAVSGWGDRQHAADRLDPMPPTVIVDERDHRLNGRSSSAWAKYADALRRISLACRNSRFSRSSALIWPVSCVVGPGRSPWSRSDRRTQLRSVSPVQPILSCNRVDRRPLRRVLRLVIKHHPNGSIPHLRRKPVCRWLAHCSILSRRGASGKPGAVHEFDLVCRRLHWGEDRVVYVGPDGALRSISAGLTDIDPLDEFQLFAGESAAFRTIDLLELCALLERLKSRSEAGDA